MCGCLCVVLCRLGSVHALRFALTHPLVQANEGVDPRAPSHLSLTAAARAKQRPRADKLQPLTHPTTTTTATTTGPTSMRMLKIQTVEDMLTNMRSRLASLETTLQSRLAAIPTQQQQQQQQPQTAPSIVSQASAVTATGAGRGGGAGSPDGVGIGTSEGADSGVESGDEEEMERECMSPTSPLDRSASPFQTRVLHARPGFADDTRSDLSPLPDEVIEAIENSDQSDAESDNDLDNDKWSSTDKDESGPSQSPKHQYGGSCRDVPSEPVSPSGMGQGGGGIGQQSWAGNNGDTGAGTPMGGGPASVAHSRAVSYAGVNPAARVGSGMRGRRAPEPVMIPGSKMGSPVPSPMQTPGSKRASAKASSRAAAQSMSARGGSILSGDPRVTPAQQAALGYA